MSDKAKITTNHEVIKNWVEERGGRPVSIFGTGIEGAPGVLRIEFPGYGDEGRFDELSWEEFFDKFEKENLAFLYQDETSGGEESRFFKFIQR